MFAFFLFSLAFWFCVATHVWSGWRWRQRLETTHCLQERLLSQPSCYTVVLEGTSVIHPHMDTCTRTTDFCKHVLCKSSSRVGSSPLSLHPACNGFDGLAFEDQSLFGRTGLFALMKEPKVVPALVIICLDLSVNTQGKQHTQTTVSCHLIKWTGSNGFCLNLGCVWFYGFPTCTHAHRLDCKTVQKLCCFESFHLLFVVEMSIMVWG